MDCRALQREEWEVLESIYPEYIASPEGRDHDFNLEIPIEFEEPRRVEILQNDITVLSSSAQSLSIVLASLPPLTLNIILPPSYPLQSPPELRGIRATHSWLPLPKRLQSLLLDRWQPGQGALYDWVEFIRTGSFLQDPEYASLTDNNIQLTSLSPSALSGLLMDYDADTKRRQFAQAAHSCAICLTVLKGSKCVKLSCSHVYCRSCLRDFWDLCITEGDVGRVGCPDPDCVKHGREADVEEVSRIINEAGVQRWKWLRTKRDLERDPTIVHCPMDFCQYPVRKPTSEDEDSGWNRLRTCPACSFAFCSFCKRTWHGPHTVCPIAFSEKLVLEYLGYGEHSPERREMEVSFGRNNILKLVRTYEEEQANKAWIESSTMACPGCHLHVQKSLGCNHMTCIKCRQHFCYRCGSKLSGQNPYAHFSQAGQPCYQKLFDFNAESEEWVEIE